MDWLHKPYAVQILGGAIATLLAAGVTAGLLLAFGTDSNGQSGRPHGKLEINVALYRSGTSASEPWTVSGTVSNIGDGHLYGCALLAQDVDEHGWPLRWPPLTLDNQPWALAPGASRGESVGAPWRRTDYTVPALHYSGSRIYVEAWAQCETPQVVSQPFFFMIDFATDQTWNVNPGIDDPWRDAIPSDHRCKPRLWRHTSCDMKKLDLTRGYATRT